MQQQQMQVDDGVDGNNAVAGKNEAGEVELSIDVSVLQAIKEAQAQHGLKYENYQRYRTYCSHRLHRLRRSLNVHQGVATSAKARHQRAKKLIDITSAMVVEAGQKTPEYGERMLLIPMYLAERAWAHAMQLKQEVAEEPRKKYHLVRRLKKAMTFAQRFEKLVHDDESPCKQRTKTESVAYAAYISGMYYFETEEWLNAKECLKKALDIYFALSVWSDYQERIDEIKASLRYCNFHLPKEAQAKLIAQQQDDNIPKNLTFHDVASHHALQLIKARILGSVKPKKVAPQTPPASTASKQTSKDAAADEDDDEDWDDACETFE